MMAYVAMINSIHMCAQTLFAQNLRGQVHIHVYNPRFLAEERGPTQHSLAYDQTKSFSVNLAQCRLVEV